MNRTSASAYRCDELDERVYDITRRMNDGFLTEADARGLIVAEFFNARLHVEVAKKIGFKNHRSHRFTASQVEDLGSMVLEAMTQKVMAVEGVSSSFEFPDLTAERLTSPGGWYRQLGTMVARSKARDIEASLRHTELFIDDEGRGDFNALAVETFDEQASAAQAAVIELDVQAAVDAWTSKRTGSALARRAIMDANGVAAVYRSGVPQPTTDPTLRHELNQLLVAPTGERAAYSALRAALGLLSGETTYDKVTADMRLVEAWLTMNDADLANLETISSSMAHLILHSSVIRLWRPAATAIKKLTRTVQNGLGSDHDAAEIVHTWLAAVFEPADAATFSAEQTLARWDALATQVASIDGNPMGRTGEKVAEKIYEMATTCGVVTQS